MFADIHCIFFDLDGTLVDSAPDAGAAANHMRQRCGLPALQLADYRPHVGKGAPGMLAKALGIQRDHAEYPACRQEFHAIYAQQDCRLTRPFKGVQALIEALREQNLDWGIVTNKQENLARPLLQKYHFMQSSRVLVCGDHTPRLKPHPDCLLLALQKTGMAARHSLYVGDDARDMQAGQAAGMHTVAASYGYLGADENAADWQADAIIRQPLDLLNLLDLA